MKPVIAMHTALALAVGASVISLAQAAPPSASLQAAFTWQMAERTRAVVNVEFKPEITSVSHRMIEGPVAGVPGLYGGVSSVPLDQINPPDGYEVTFDGCASSGPVKQYQWRVDGKRLPSNATRCTVTTRLHEGPHEVELLVKYKGQKSSVKQTVEVKDYLVVIMGDSYSSGEGNATRYDGATADDAYAATVANDGAGWSEGAYWDYANCHRSTRAGQANAAIDLEQADPHSSVTTLFLACSGAQIDSGILGIKDGYLGAPEKPQTLLAYELAIANGRDIDAITLGIGGNDVGFVPIVAEGLVQEDAFLSTETSAIKLFEPPLPITDQSPLSAAELATLVLTPIDGFPALPPGPPFRTLNPAALHACDSQFQRAAFGDGGLGPAESCRESIGTTEFGLAQVHACLTGTGDADCQFARSYYTFPDPDEEIEGGWKYPDGASSGLDVPERWPGLGVAPAHVFYTEYPDLTTEFARGSSEGDAQENYEFCSISFTKNQLKILLLGLKPFVDNPEVIDALIAALDVIELGEFGLAQNEFTWASDAVLNGFDEPMDRVLTAELTGRWKAPKSGIGSSWIVVPDGDVEVINYGKGGEFGPALNEMTTLAGGRYGWTPVVGTHDLASGHGLCTPQPDGGNDAEAAYAYLIGPVNGTNGSGSAHPNLLGQETYRQPLAAALQAALLSAD